MRPVIPVVAVLLSYVVAFAYIGMDSYSQVPPTAYHPGGHAAG